MKTPELLKLTVKPSRNSFGKLDGEYVAIMLGVERRAKSREQAIESLAEMLDKTMEHAFARRYLVCSNGNVFALYHVPGGWAYDIIHTDKIGAISCGSTMMSEKSYTDAYETMKRHWEQMESDCLAPKTV